MKKLFLFLIFPLFLSACQKSPTVSTPTPNPGSNQVPLPRAEDAIVTFYNLVNEKRIPEALEMMLPSALIDDSAKQAYAVLLNSFQSVKVKEAKPCTRDVCAPDTYEVVLDVVTSTPNYGFDTGLNTRWYTVQKSSSGLYQLSLPATGP